MGNKGIGAEDFVVTYELNADEAIKVARTDYVFFGVSLEDIEKLVKNNY